MHVQTLARTNEVYFRASHRYCSESVIWHNKTNQVKSNQCSGIKSGTKQNYIRIKSKNYIS